MADINIGAKIQVDSSQASESVKSVRAQLKDAQNELLNTQAKFGDLSKEAVTAAKKVAELKDRIGDAKAMSDAFNPDRKFAAFGQSVQGVVGGFAAMQGVMGLVGAEGQNVEKMMLKVQSAMALTQGLDTLRESMQGFKTLGTIIKGQVVSAFTTLKGAIAATGLGLVVVALGTIVAYWDDIKGAVTGVSREQEKNLDTATKLAETEESKLSAIDDQSNILKLQGKSEREILAIKIKQIEAVIQAKTAELEAQKGIVQAQIVAEKRNRDILRGILDFVTKPIQLLIDGVSKVASVFGADFKFNIADSISKMVFDEKAVEEEGKKTIDAIEKNLQVLQNQKAGFKLQVQAIDKQASDKAAQQQQEADKKRIAAEEAAAKQIESIRNELSVAKSPDERAKEIESLRQEYEERKAVIQAGNGSLLELDEWKRVKEAEVKDRFDKEAAAKEEERLKAEAERKKANDFASVDGFDTSTLEGKRAQLEAKQLLLDEYYAREIAAEGLTAEQKRAIELKYTQDSKALTDARIAISKSEAEAKAQHAQVVGGALDAVSDLVGKHTAIGKGLAVASAIINTQQGITQALAAYPPPFSFIAAGAVGLKGLASIKNILSTKVPGQSGSGGGVSLASAATAIPAPLAPQNTTTQLDQNTINGIGSAASNRAYVLDADVQNNQEKATRLSRAARIG